MVLLAGSTSDRVKAVVCRLRELNKAVRGLIRRTSDHLDAERYKDLGAESIIGNVADTASLASACCGNRPLSPQGGPGTPYSSGCERAGGA
jgi:hypothetical protein